METVSTETVATKTVSIEGGVGMDYDGHVDVGGAAQRRILPRVTITKFAVSDMSNNIYLVQCRSTGETLLIDAANDFSRIQREVADVGGRLSGVLTTHRHADHVQALSSVVDAYPNTVTYAGRHDAEALPVPPDVELRDGSTIELGDVTLHIRELRGHTPGAVSAALELDEGTHIFTGDSLFPGGVGKTQNPQDFASLIDDVQTRLFDVYDDAWIYPGHGGDTTLAVERPELPQWRKRGW